MVDAHTNARLEAFCDGVFAIALTLLIIEIKVPPPAGIATTADMWRALWHLAPAVLAFVLSFVIILITWVNHHGALGLIRRSSASFFFANGFLLLTVVVIPFPTALLGEFLLTDHAAPAVVLYNAVLAVQAIAWISVGSAALRDDLVDGERALSQVRENRRNGYFGFVFYSLLAVTAFWFPLAVAIVTILSWLFWLMLGIKLKQV